MHNADLYEQNNGVQKRDALACLEKYAPDMKWKKKGNRIIDIGCGDGTVTNMLKKYFPNDYKLLGVDISESMVNFAYDHHCNENTSFAVLDIEDDLPDSLKGKFNHVFSFYTLHWIQNQKKAFENIFNLLEQDGQCFMTFLASNPIYDAFRALSRRSKWSNLLLQEDVKKFVCPYHDLEEPDKEVTKMMKNIGFNKIDVVCKELIFTFDNLDDLRNHLRTINPFKIPKHMYDDFLDDLIEILQDIGANQIDKSNKCVRIDYKLLIVYGHKPDIEMS